MPDICDQSDVTIEQTTLAALSAVKKPPREPYLGCICVECQIEEVPARRAALGYDTCMECANEIAERNKHFASGHGAY
jgi:hypothetical protein